MINREIKRAMRQRIEKDSFKSALVLTKAVRKFKIQKSLRLKREQGIFDATIYLEPVHEHERIKSKHQVQVFGEFTEHAPWSEKIQCVYDHRFECFKANI